MGSSKEDEQMPVDNIVSFVYSFKCITCYQRLRDGSWATAATSAPKTCKKKWRVRPRCCTSGCRRQNPKILCCGTKQNYHYVEEVDSPRDYDEKLTVDGQGLLHSRVMSYVASKSQKRAFSELPLFVRPLTISPKAITKEGITSGRRFLKRPGVEVWPMPQLETSATAGMSSPPRRRTRANENA